MSDDTFVFDASMQSFESDVVLRSVSTPVLVDFWAEWCAPCRALTPVLTQVVESYGGRLLLAKVDTDREQSLAAQHGIRSLPTVRLYRNREVVAEFMGAQPESQIRALLEQHLPRESNRLLDQALAVAEDGNVEAAAALLEDAYVQDPTNDRLVEALADFSLRAGRLERVAQMLSSLPSSQRGEPWVRAVEARLLFAQVASSGESTPVLREKLEEDPSNHEARYQLGARFVVNGELEAAMQELLELMKSSRSFGDDAGRKGLIALFEQLGNGHPLVSQYRQRMASLLH